MKLEFDILKSDDQLLISLKGELTRDECSEFKKWFIRSVEHWPHGNEGSVVDVDCGELHYLDSTGLGSLVFCRKALLDSGIRMRLVKTSGWLHKFLQVTALQEVFEIGSESTPEQA